MNPLKLGPIATMLIAVCVCQGQSAQAGPAFQGEAGPKPLLLEKKEGEHRIWCDPPLGGFTLKVSPENNGSEHLVMGTEDLLPGDSIPAHKHLGQDEIVLVLTGTLHVRLGDQKRDLHAGGMAFIPAYTWVSLKNNDTQPASIMFIWLALKRPSRLPLAQTRSHAIGRHGTYENKEKAKLPQRRETTVGWMRKKHRCSGQGGAFFLKSLFIELIDPQKGEHYIRCTIPQI